MYSVLWLLYVYHVTVRAVQICIKWGLQHGTSVIPKATGEDHVVGNIDVFDWELSSEDFEVRPCSMSLQLTLQKGWFIIRHPVFAAVNGGNPQSA